MFLPAASSSAASDFRQGVWLRRSRKEPSTLAGKVKDLEQHWGFTHAKNKPCSVSEESDSFLP